MYGYGYRYNSGLVVGAGGGGGGSFVLDTYPNAEVGYSLRQLSASATNCVRVRRSSDNAEQDIGFASGVVDSASILSFAGGSVTVVTKWYDQSTNGNDASIPTAVYQPTIASGGVIKVSAYNGLPAIFFDGANDRLNLLNGITTTQEYYQSAVFDRPIIGKYSITLGNSVGGGIPTPFLWHTLNRIYTAMPSFVLHDTGYTQTGDFLVTTLRDTSNDIKFWINGAQGTTGNQAGIGDTLNAISSQGFHNGMYQELIYWGETQEANQTDIELDINNFYSIY
jgi:hypothetical protein